MESLNMNTLASSLPTSNLANAEKDLLDNFKAAALSITTLYRSSLRTSKRSYNAGYAAACQDLLVVIQQGVSVGGGGQDGEGGMTIGRVMDWVEARLEAIKTREEEEDEENEERECRARAAASTPARVPIVSRDKPSADASTTQPSTARPPPPQPQQHPASNANMLPPPPPPPTSTPRRTKHRAAREKEKGKEKEKEKDRDKDNSPTGISFPTPNDRTSPARESVEVLPPIPMSLSIPTPVAGAKRRHTALLDSHFHPYLHPSLNTSPPVSFSALPPVGTYVAPGLPLSSVVSSNVMVNAGGSTPGSGRRRSKAARISFNTHGSGRTENSMQAQNDAAMAMDVEEEGGRERKRVTRR